MSEKVRLGFTLETTSIAEISDNTASDWETDDVVSIDEGVLQEMTKDDSKPFFVDFTALYEGVSGNNRKYTQDAVKTCVDAMVGVNMYKGHQAPGTESWQYREPVGKIVASKLCYITINGERVLAAKGKAYITDADAKLRSDITKKMAGPLSILGNARAVRELGSSQRTVTKIHKPLTSIDFCNPGTNGMALAGVTAVVQEMSQDEATITEEPVEEPNMGKMTKEELLAEYPEVFSEVVGEQLSSRVDELAAEKLQVAEQQQSFVAKEREYTEKVAEMDKANSELQSQLEELQKKLDDQTGMLQRAELDKFAAATIKALKDGDDHDAKVVEMACDGIEPQLIDGDIDKSKKAFEDTVKAAIAKTERIVEMAGGNITQADSDTRSHTSNPKPDSKGKLASRFISPELVGDKDK